MSRVLFATFDPFNIACYDTVKKAIVIDKKFKRSKMLRKLLEHEDEHSKSKNLIDFDVELFNRIPLNDYPKIMKKKPLWIFSILFFPFIGYKYRGKWNWSVDYLRIVLDIVLVTFILLLINLL